jgi:hypothetical protein
MRTRNVPLQTAFVLILLGLALPLHAQRAEDVLAASDLTICNKGTVPVEVAAASKQGDSLLGHWWLITSAMRAPGECATVTNLDNDVSYIAFGLTDAKGGMESGSIAQTPDIGSVPRNLLTILGPAQKTLTGDAKGMCARKGATRYRMTDDFTTDCSNFKLSGPGPDVGEGPFLPLTSALLFHPNTDHCYVDAYGVPQCNESHYYLNIYPSATDRELHATPGTKSGADGGAGDSSACGKVSCWDLLRQGLAQAIKDSEAQRAANANGPHPPHPPAIPPPSPPSAARPMWPANEDDPIGGGGFITPPSNPATAPARANPLQWVRSDIPAYIEASKTGFAAYKNGDGQISQDLRMWDSSVKPSAARGCWVVQGATSTTLSCALSQKGDLNGLRPYYTELNQEIAAALPRDWTQVEQPFGGDLPSHGYRSSSGAHLEVWVAPAAAGAGYEIHFQLVSAH